MHIGIIHLILPLTIVAVQHSGVCAYVSEWSCGRWACATAWAGGRGERREGVYVYEQVSFLVCVCVFFFQAEAGIRDSLA